MCSSVHLPGRKTHLPCKESLNTTQQEGCCHSAFRLFNACIPQSVSGRTVSVCFDTSLTWKPFNGAWKWIYTRSRPLCAPDWSVWHLVCWVYEVFFLIYLFKFYLDIYEDVYFPSCWGSQKRKDAATAGVVHQRCHELMNEVPLTVQTFVFLLSSMTLENHSSEFESNWVYFPSRVHHWRSFSLIVAFYGLSLFFFFCFSSCSLIWLISCCLTLSAPQILISNPASFWTNHHLPAWPPVFLSLAVFSKLYVKKIS